MNKTYKIVIIIALSLFAFSKGIAYASALFATDSKHGLQMEISLSASEFLLGEPVLLQIVIKNISAEPIRLPYHYPFSREYLTYTVEGPRAPTYLWYPFSPIINEVPYDSKISYLLKPTEVVTTTINLVKCLITMTGHFKVKVVFRGIAYKAMDPPFFEGELTASLEFDVLLPIGEDAAFLESFKEWLKAKNIKPENRCYFFIYSSEMNCTDELVRKYPTSRYTSWILIREIMGSEILSPKDALEFPRYCNTRYKEHICDLSSPEGKRTSNTQKVKENVITKRKWDIETIDNILALHPDAPFSASLKIQKATNIIELGNEPEGLKLLQKFIQECNDKKIVSRECNWAKEFIELWAKKEAQ